MLLAVYDAIPSIATLTLGGARVIDSLLALILSQFKKLKTLGLVDTSSLHVGFNPPRCGNVYIGPNGDEIRRKVEAQHGVALQTPSLALASILMSWFLAISPRLSLPEEKDGKFKTFNAQPLLTLNDVNLTYDVDLQPRGKKKSSSSSSDIQDTPSRSPGYRGLRKRSNYHYLGLIAGPEDHTGNAFMSLASLRVVVVRVAVLIDSTSRAG
ncbi:hypothetical protein DFS33DRAFT_1385380 [Desarmillaria ectypa]|nr:hypothetical protein DFS33DRAFT_1385380 [Desarmillaria ectypa]